MPLLAKQSHTQWQPDMIYFENTKLLRSANYFVQQMFGQNQGDVYFQPNVAPASTNLAASCVKDSASGDLILKLVNVSADEIQANLKISGLEKFKPVARGILLAGSPGANNTVA